MARVSSESPLYPPSPKKTKTPCVSLRLAGHTDIYNYYSDSSSSLLETETLISYCSRCFRSRHWAASVHKDLAPGTIGNNRK